MRVRQAGRLVAPLAVIVARSTPSEKLSGGARLRKYRCGPMLLSGNIKVDKGHAVDIDRGPAEPKQSSATFWKAMTYASATACRRSLAYPLLSLGVSPM
jgi:hypothetical protein